MQGGYGPPPGGGGGYGGPPPGGGYGGAPPPGGGGYGGAPPPGGGYGGAPYGAPPQAGYGPPVGAPYPGGMGGPLAPGGGGLTPQAATVLRERSSIMVPVLAFLTCGVYLMIWNYQTTDELRVATGDNSINPGLDLILGIVTCGIWSMYTHYRNVKKVADTFRQMGIQRADQSTPVILCMVFGVAFVAWYLVQEELNALTRVAQGRPI